ncbi:hypothetical protein J2777_004111 [Paraburkholderia graminis]|jgi:hypothetical protein|uniref:hypothetical protein n=1 Tax=Paraburkholderia graminis TaxID=60548 RepID=UPI0028579425|nr:hypothetical protein [Paraburkholderia graminis]MDR6470372.1 hypothetical protein [Paraburkholderia graminis]
MKIVMGRMAATVVIAASLCGAVGTACAQSGGTRAVPSTGNVAGGGTVGSTLTPSPGLATPGGSIGTGLSAGGVGTGLNSGHVPNTMRANGTSLNQNPDPRVPSLSGRPAAPR